MGSFPRTASFAGDDDFHVRIRALKLAGEGLDRVPDRKYIPRRFPLPHLVVPARNSYGATPLAHPLGHDNARQARELVPLLTKYAADINRAEDVLTITVVSREGASPETIYCRGPTTILPASRRRRNV